MENNIFDNVKITILKYFPSASAIIVWGSSVKPNFSPKYGDIDLIIVDDTRRAIEESQSLLNQAVEKLSNEVELDPALAATEDLKDLKFITTYNTRTAHGIDHYQIKYISKIIYGDEKILDIISDITLDEALKDVVPHIKEVFIKDLRDVIQNGIVLEEEKDKFLVIIRTLYTLETKQVGTKLEAIEYLSNEYPELETVLEYFKCLYIKQKPELVPNDADILKLLNIAEEAIDSF